MLEDDQPIKQLKLLRIEKYVCLNKFYFDNVGKYLYNDFLKTVGQNIRLQRCIRGISQDELAFSIDSARNYIGCIERAEKTLSLKTLFKIAKTLDIKVEDLFKDTM